MSRIVTTKIGRFNQVQDGNEKRWLWECPRCLSWQPLPDLDGEYRMQCQGPRGGSCDYDETHHFGRVLVETMQVRILLDESPQDVGATA